MLESNNAHFKRKMKISNEQLKKLLPNDSKNIIPVVRNNVVMIPIKNFCNIGISSVSIPLQNYDTGAISFLSIRLNNIEDVSFLLNDDELVCEIYKKENGDIFLELSSLYYDLNQDNIKGNNCYN